MLDFYHTLHEVRSIEEEFWVVYNYKECHISATRSYRNLKQPNGNICKEKHVFASEFFNALCPFISRCKNISLCFLEKSVTLRFSFFYEKKEVTFPISLYKIVLEYILGPYIHDVHINVKITQELLRFSGRGFLLDLIEMMVYKSQHYYTIELYDYRYILEEYIKNWEATAGLRAQKHAALAFSKSEKYSQIVHTPIFSIIIAYVPLASQRIHFK